MRRLLLSTSILAAAITATPALAQAADDESASSGDTIIVTARKREENLIDVPLPMSVATESQLKRDQVYNLNDLPRITPALELSQTSGGETNGGARLRGLGTGVFNPSVSPSVALVVDQMPVGNLAFPQLYDLAQIEVLRGPQGTLFGQGASAGVLNIRTKAPSTDKLGVSGSLVFADKGSAGAEVGELIVNGAINVPFGDSAALRIATQYKKETGLQRSVTTGKDNVIEDFGIRAKLLLKPSDRFTVNITAEMGKETQDGQTFFAIAVAPNSTVLFDPPGPPPPGLLGALSTAAFLANPGCAMTVISARAEEYCEAIPSYLELKIVAFGAVIDWEVSDELTLTSVTSYRERRFDQPSRDFSRLSTGAAARNEKQSEKSRGFNQEIRLAYSGDKIDAVFGGIYSDFHFDRIPMGTGPFVFGNNLQGQRIGFSVCPASGLGFCPVGTAFTREDTNNRTIAFFADATMNLTEKLELFAGVRYSDYNNTTKVGVNTLAATTSFKTIDSNASGRIGVSFRPNSDTNLYASYSIGYKPPAVGTNPAGALFQLKPEESDAFELGAKFRVGRFQLATNVFYTKLVNFQSQTSVFVGTALVSQPLNIPKLESKGFEVTVMGEVLPGLNINAGYQYNDVKFPGGYLGDDGGLLGGTQFLNAPKHKFTLSGEYSVPLSDGVEVFLNGNVIFKSATLLAARADPRFRYRGHEIVNLGFGVREPDGKWTLSVFVRNLTKEREPSAYLASTFFGAADGGIRAWPVSGLTARVVGVTAGFDF